MGDNDRPSAANQAAREEREGKRRQREALRRQWEAEARQRSFRGQARYDAQGTPHCPRCGGTHFRARRSRGALAAGALTFGVGAALTRRSEVECTACKWRAPLGPDE